VEVAGRFFDCPLLQPVDMIADVIARPSGRENLIMLTRQLAPEPILRGALRVVFVASYMTRNWAADETVSRRQIYDLWEALHVVPDLVCRWHEGAMTELLRYFDEYNQRWPEPRLRVLFDQAIG
jgi:hypothetical protein